MNVKTLPVKKDVRMNGIMVCLATGILFLTVVSIFPAMAHPPGDMHNPDRIVSVLKERMQLTDEQTEKLRVIFEEQDKEMKSLFEKFHERRRSEESNMRNEMDTVRKKAETKLLCSALMQQK